MRTSPATERVPSFSITRARCALTVFSVMPKREAKGDARAEPKRDPRREGHSLADLLDPETLARLRGDG